MALRDTVFAAVAAGAMLAAPAALAQDATPATFSLDGQVYASQVEAESDPAFSDGVILIGDSDFKPVAFLVNGLESRDINAAIIQSDDGNVTLLFDGDAMNTWTNEEFSARSARVFSVVQQLKDAQDEQRADAGSVVQTPEAG